MLDLILRKMSLERGLDICWCKMEVHSSMFSEKNIHREGKHTLVGQLILVLQFSTLAPALTTFFVRAHAYIMKKTKGITLWLAMLKSVTYWSSSNVGNLEIHLYIKIQRQGRSNWRAQIMLLYM